MPPQQCVIPAGSLQVRAPVEYATIESGWDPSGSSRPEEGVYVPYTMHQVAEEILGHNDDAVDGNWNTIESMLG